MRLCDWIATCIHKCALMKQSLTMFCTIRQRFSHFMPSCWMKLWKQTLQMIFQLDWLHLLKDCSYLFDKTIIFSASHTKPWKGCWKIIVLVAETEINVNTSTLLICTIKTGLCVSFSSHWIAYFTRPTQVHQFGHSSHDSHGKVWLVFRPSGSGKSGPVGAASSCQRLSAFSAVLINIRNSLSH